MKPEELLDPASFPEDLQWVVTRYRLQPEDPVFLLVAWHWNRMKACEDTVRGAILEMRTLLDTRVEALGAAVDSVEGIEKAVGQLQAALEQKPKELAAQLDGALKKPVTEAVAQLESLTQALSPLARNFEIAKRRQLLAVLLVGVTVGVLGSVILFQA